jgi:hypothetical protein
MEIYPAVSGDCCQTCWSRGPEHADSALLTSRPPEIVIPERGGIDRRRPASALQGRGVREHCDNTRAAAATRGVAIEVPLMKACALLGVVDSTLTPGAPRWTER